MSSNFQRKSVCIYQMNPVKPTALLIDDEPQIRKLLRLALESDGYAVHEAENGERGLAEVAGEAPDGCLGVDDLLAIGWPGEKMARSSALNRLYVALATLRSLGLRDVIVRRPEGYALRARLERGA